MTYFLKTFKSLILIFIGAFVLWQFWIFLAPRPDPLQSEERAAVRDAVERLVQELQARTGDRELTFGIIPFRNDPSGEVTAATRAALATGETWTVDDTAVVRRIIGDIAKSIADASSIEEVLQVGRQVSLDVLVLGRVIDLAILPEGATATIEFQLRDLRSGDWLLQQTLTGTWQPSILDQLRSPAPPWLRLVVWVLIVVALPWVTAFLTHWTIEKKSNQASAFLVLAYSTMALLLAALFLGFSLEGATSWLLLTGAVVLAGSYSWWACERIAERG